MSTPTRSSPRLRARLPSSSPMSGVSVPPLPPRVQTPPPWAWVVIPPQDLLALDSYKYTGTDLSLLVELFLRSFWNWLIEFFPRWIAPNTITLLGFLAMISSFALSYSYCPLGVGCDIPGGVWLYAAATLFFYQTMDNLDGKQARRTGSSSALGELFDHGCDSLFLLLISVPLSTALGLEAGAATVMLCWGMAMFYLAHWEEYHSGHLILARLANPTEAQVLLMLLLLGGAWLGPATLTTTTLSLPLPTPMAPLTVSLTQLIVWANNLGCFFSCLDSTLKLLKWQRSHQAPLLPLLLRVAPLLLLLGAGLGWVALEPLLLKGGLVHLWALLGVGSSFLVVDLMLCRITRAPFPTLRVWLVALLPALGLVHSALGSPLVPPLALLPLLLLFLLAVYTYYLLSVIAQLTAYLGIRVFHIPH